MFWTRPEPQRQHAQAENVLSIAGGPRVRSVTVDDETKRAVAAKLRGLANEHDARYGKVECPVPGMLRASARAIVPPRLTALGHSGPACVASEDYREGWETIFGKPVTPAQA